jgi:predicted metalloendopeptidase
VYTGCTLLEQKYIKSTTQYLDEFYKTINNPKAWKKEFAYPCDKSGTGNVILKGLKEE